MPNPQDEEFLRFAVAGSFLTDQQAQEVLGALREIERLGGSASAPDLAMKRGVLGERQVGLVQQAIAAGRTGARVPRELDSFELLEKIGQGGMGSVFKARQKELDRIVAVKILSPRLARSKEFVEQFLREARSAGRLNHANIVAAIDVGECQGFYYFAMEYVDGEPLSRLLAREGPLPEARALAIAADVARALDHAYQKGLIHRDIKPDNIMVTRDGRVRVTDFGLAKAIGTGAPDASEAERFLGTPAYVAPEQIRSEPDIDCRADIFSLGVTLFQVLTGELPFKGANPMAIAAAVVSEPLPSIRKLRPDLSGTAARIVEKMTAKDRSARFATPAELVAALDAAAAAPRPAAQPAGLPGARPAAEAEPARRIVRRRRRTRSTAIAVVSMILPIAAGAAFAIYHYNRMQKNRSGEPNTGEAGDVHGPMPPTSSTPFPDTRQPVANEALMKQLTGRVERANQLESRQPRAYAAILTLLRKILDDFPPIVQESLPPDGQELLRQTAAKLKRLEGELEKAADASLGDLATRADALFAEGKINEGLAAFDSLPTELQTPRSRARLRTLRDECRPRAVAAFALVDAKGKQLVEQGKLKDAKALYGGYRLCVVSEIAERATTAIETIDQELAKTSVEAVRLARGAYVQEARTILERLAAREYDVARGLVGNALVDSKLAAVREELRGLQHLARIAAEVSTTAGFGAKKLKPGDVFRLGGLGGEVIRADEEKLVLKFGEATTTRRLTELKARDVADLAVKGYGPATAQVEAKLGLFFLAERDYASARKRIENAKAGGIDVAREMDLLDRFAPRACRGCDGAKVVPCPVCQGTGVAQVDRQECPACKGQRGGRCGWCKGDGRLRCANCGGSGRIGPGFVCAECGGTGRAKCSHCGGDGYIKCSKCKGTGTIVTSTPCGRCRGAKTVPCPTCNGAGELPPADLVPPRAEPAAPAPPDREAP